MSAASITSDAGDFEQQIQSLLGAGQLNRALTLCLEHSRQGPLSWAAVQRCVESAVDLEAHGWLRDLRSALARRSPRLREPAAFVVQALISAGLFDWSGALDALDEARRAGRNDVDLALFRARMLERMLRPDEALTVLDEIEAKANAGQRRRAALVRATCLLQQGQAAEVESFLVSVLPDLEQGEEAGTAWKHLAKALDKQGKYEEAAEACDRGNELIAAANQFDPATNEMRRTVEVQRQLFRPEWVAGWSSLAPSEPAPVFLVGFPRSGTTLLEQVLDSHPDIVTLEEQPTVNHTLKAMMTLMLAQANIRLKGRIPRDWLAQQLAVYGEMKGLSQAAADRFRDQYWKAVEGYVSASATQLVIDKHPLNSIQMGLIRRLFPNARFIFALRHPCDVLVSCCMQTFEPNPAMLNFTSVEQAARLYRGVTNLADQYCTVLGLKEGKDILFTRYEDLVADFDGQIDRVLGFLGLAWNDSVRAYADHAKRKQNLSTPSYQGVTQAIYSGSIGRWRHYRKWIEPAVPILQEALARYGYSLEPDSQEGQ